MSLNTDIQNIRKSFPVLKQEMNGRTLVYLDNAATTQKPQIVIDAISEYYTKYNSNVHRGIHTLSQQATQAFENSRKKVRETINAREAYEIIFTSGATEAINMIAFSYGEKYINQGDEIIISGMEHHSNIVPWQLLAERKKAHIKVLPVDDNGELMLDKLDTLISNKTRIIAVNHVSNTLGTINPVKEITKKAHARNIPVLVDGAQGMPHLEVDVQDLNVDFYCFSGHKVYGPTGIGAVYGKEKWLADLPPYKGGGEMISRVTFEKTTFNELPYKFEAGTPNIAGVIGLHKALEFLEMHGKENIRNIENELLIYATDQLKQIDGVKIYGEATNKASVISFLINNIHPYDAGTIFDKLGIAIRTGHHCTQPLMDQYNIPGTMRASFAPYNTKKEIDILVAAIHKVKTMFG
ncbi:MAG: aminotransferase class V-fold PLP-dependent enzyme [Bacteroidales bacterium]